MTSWHEDFSALLTLCEENPLATDGFSSQMKSDSAFWFFLFLYWTSCWTNNRVARDVRRRCNVTVMNCHIFLLYLITYCRICSSVNGISIGSGNDLFGAKPLPEPTPYHWQHDTKEQASEKFGWKYKTFHSWKYIWKCRLHNVWEPP